MLRESRGFARHVPANYSLRGLANYGIWWGQPMRDTQVRGGEWPMRRIRVRVPASTANLGPGFDTLGMALSLYNEVELSDEGEGVQLLVEGEGKSALEKAGSRNVALRAIQSTLEEFGIRPV